MNYIIEILASVTECCIVVRFCNQFLGFRNERLTFLKSLAFFILLAADNIFLSQLSGFEILSLVILLTLIFLYSMLFLKGRLYQKLLTAVTPTIIMLPINMITVNAFKAFSDCSAEELTAPGGDLRFSILFITKSAFFLVCEALVKVRRKNRYLLSGFQWVIQLSCFFASSVIAVSLWSISRTSGYSENQFLLIYIMIAVLNILLYALLGKMERDSVINEENRITQVNLAAQEQLVSNVQEQFTKIQTLRHDMKHCLTTTAELLESGKIDSAKSYVESILKQKIDTSAGVIATGSPVIDAVVNSKLSECEKNKISTKIRIDTMLGSINEIDMSILISNLLDNAIEGCNGSEAPLIEFTISRQKSFLYIIVKNTISDSVLSANPNLVTNKDNKSLHGFGIKSIRELARKYNGTVEFRENGSFFIAEICLSITE
ncbi:MAG: sensor histidine kinase [Oscillospiraceae bacterium]